MAGKASNNGFLDASPIERLIAKTRRLLRSGWVLTGLGLSLGLAIGSLVIVTLADLAIPLGTTMRMTALLLVVVPTVWVFIAGVLRPLFRRLTRGHMARRIESHLTGIHNRLVSCVDLAPKEKPQVYSLAFYRRLLTETLERISGFRPSKVMDLISIRRAGILAAASIVALAISFLTFSDRLPTAMARVFSPFADIPPVSGVLYTVIPGTSDVLRGDDVEIIAAVEKGEPSSLRLEVNLDDEEGAKTLWYDLQPGKDKNWTFTLAGLQQSFSYRVHGGGTWSKLHRITMLDRPQIDNLHTVLRYPEYMGISEPVKSLPGSADVTGPEESTVEVIVEVEGTASVGEIQLLQAPVRIEQPVESGQDQEVVASTADTETRELIVSKSFPLQPAGSPREMDGRTLQQWKGTFPLRKDGWYRVEFRNSIGATNPPMEEAKLTAIPDEPPQVVLDLPGTDLVLSTPVKVPLFISAYDDFGLSEIVVSIQRGDSEGFQGRPVKKYKSLTHNDTAIVTLDLAAEKLSAGQTLRYRAEVRDRKGQSAQTKDWTIRIADEPNAADKQLAQFEQQQDAFRELIAKLLEQQAKVKAALEQVSEKFAPLTEKMEAAQNAANKQANSEPPAEQPKPPELDPESAKLLEQLKQELAKIAGQEEQNVQQGKQAAAELKKLAEQASEQQLLPPELARQLAMVDRAFEPTAVKPMQELSELLKNAGKPKTDPRLDQAKQMSEKLQSDLQALKDRLDAVAQASRQSREDPEAALAQFKREMLRQNAALTAQELANLKSSVREMRDDLKELLKNQKQLAEFTPDVPNLLLDDLLKKQQELDQETDQELAQVRRLLDTNDPAKTLVANLDPKAQNKQKPNQNQEKPQPPESGEAPKDKSPPQKKDDAGKADQDAPKSPFRPVLSDKQPKVDPQLAKLMQKAKTPKKSDSEDDEKSRTELGSQQAKRLQDLSFAEQSLTADRNSLQELMQELAQAISQDKPPAKPNGQGKPPESNDPEVEDQPLTPQQAENVAEVIQSERMQKALAMAARLQEMTLAALQPADGQSSEPKTPADSQQPNEQPPTLSQLALGNLIGVNKPENVLAVELKDFDLAARTIILKMQPRLREELLQGLREQGPEGYRKFIRNYYRRLTKVQSKPEK